MKKQKSISIEQLKDRFIGPAGSEERQNYELELSLDIIGDMIKQARQQRNLTQEELGSLIGVQKAQISKLERNAKNVTLSTILKVFEALDAKIKLNIELDNAA